MFKTILSYASKTMFRKKNLTILTEIAIILSIMIITAVGNTFFSLNNSYKSFLDETYGKYSFVSPADTDIVDLITADKNIENYGYIYSIGTLKLNESIFDGSISVAYTDNAVFDMSGARPIIGTLPTASGEAVIEESVAEKLGITENLGESFTITAISDSGEEEYTFILSGIVSDFSGWQGMSDENNRSVWPGILIFGETQSFDTVYSVVEFKSSLVNVAEHVLNRYGNSAMLNPLLDASSEISTIDTSSRIVLYILAVSSMLIAALCIALLSSTSSAASSEQTHNLKLLGAGSKELIMYGFVNLLILYICALLPGVLLGLGASKLLLDNVINNFVDFYSFDLSVISIITGAVLPLLLLSLITFYNSAEISLKKPLAPNEKKSKKQGARTKLQIRNLIVKWSYLYVKNNRIQYVSISAAMVLCYILLSICGIFQYTITEEYSQYSGYDYELRLTDPWSFSDFLIATRPYTGVEQNDVDKIINTNEISQISTIKMLNVLLLVNKNSPAAENFSTPTTWENSRDQDNYKTTAENYGIDISRDIYTRTLYGCDDQTLTSLISEASEADEKSMEKLKNANGVIAVCFNNTKCPYSLGESISIKQILPTDGNELPSPDFAMFEVTVKLAGIVYADSDSNFSDLFPASPAFTNDFSLVWSSDSFYICKLPLNTSHIYINLSDSRKYENTEEVLGNIKYLYPDIKITSNRENSMMMSALKKTIGITVGAIVIFIYGICLVAIINTVNIKYLTKRKLWGSLRAIGIRRSAVIIQQITDVFLTLGPAIVISYLFLSLLDWLKKIAHIRNDITFMNTWVILGFITSAVIMIATTLPLSMSVFKDNITKQLEQPE